MTTPTTSQCCPKCRCSIVGNDCGKCHNPYCVCHTTSQETIEEQISQALARGYCTLENCEKILDPDLIEAMAHEVRSLLSQVRAETEAATWKKAEACVTARRIEDPTGYGTDIAYENAINDFLAAMKQAQTLLTHE